MFYEPPFTILKSFIPLFAPIAVQWPPEASLVKGADGSAGSRDSAALARAPFRPMPALGLPVDAFPRARWILCDARNINLLEWAMGVAGFAREGPVCAIRRGRRRRGVAERVRDAYLTIVVQCAGGDGSCLCVSAVVSCGVR